MSAFAHTGQAFELRFCSNQPLSEMSPLADSAAGADEAVVIGWSSPGTAPPGGPGVSFQASEGRFQLQVVGVAHYDIGAYRIDVAPAADADDRSVRAFLFGSAIGTLLYLRGLTVLHGSTVGLPDGSAAVFCGHSTAGKSTLAAALGARGYPVLADDITAVRVDAAGQAWCLPGLARTKLWRDALDTLGLSERTSASSRVLPHIDKHALALATAVHPLPLRRFYELQVDERAELAFAAVTGMAKLSALMSHAYRPEFVQAMGLQGALMRGAAALAPRLQMNRIVRPRATPTLDAIVAWLEGQWAGQAGRAG